MEFQFSPSKRKDYHLKILALGDRLGSFNLVPPKGRIITLIAVVALAAAVSEFQFSPSKRKDYH